MQDDDKDFSVEKDSDLDDSVITEEHQSDALNKLRKKLKDAEAKAKEYLDGWQRSQADFINLRKRDEAAKIEFVKFASESFVEELLPVLDSFNLALLHGNKDIEPVFNQFMQILRQRGLEESDPFGEKFDPKLYESVGSLPAEKPEDDHKILEVIQKGYILSGKIIRPAKVKIGEYHG
ncbi:MAG: nucleotide exchange factor GrpE [Patescibacteria group bacterium]